LTEQYKEDFKNLFFVAMRALKGLFYENREQTNLLPKLSNVFTYMDPLMLNPRFNQTGAQVKPDSKKIETHADYFSNDVTPTFDSWYAGIAGEIFKNNKFDPARWNKVIQQGNLTLSQPTGGFKIDNADKGWFLSQFIRAMSEDQPRLMILTEPVKANFFSGSDEAKDLQYNIVAFGKDNKKQVGLLRNAAFAALYPGFALSGVNELPAVNGYCVAIQFNDKENNPVFKVANWHGNSSKTNQSHFDAFKMWATTDMQADYITGDSNITKAKTGISIGDVMPDFTNKDFSKVAIEKDRWDDDIILNNQIQKKFLTPEFDGMFVAELTAAPVVGEAMPSTPVAAEAMPSPPLKAFSTDYTLETPILADHSVVQIEVSKASPFVLMAANAAIADDANRGVLLKDDWTGVDLVRFHELIGKPYTAKWVKLYQNFLLKGPIKTLLTTTPGFVEEVFQFGRPVGGGGRASRFLSKKRRRSRKNRLMLKRTVVPTGSRVRRRSSLFKKNVAQTYYGNLRHSKNLSRRAHRRPRH